MVMAKYEIELYYTTHCTVVVEADNKEAAIEEAWMEAGKGEYDEQICGNCVHDFVGDIEELDEHE